MEVVVVEVGDGEGLAGPPPSPPVPFVFPSPASARINISCLRAAWRTAMCVDAAELRATNESVMRTKKEMSVRTRLALPAERRIVVKRKGRKKNGTSNNAQGVSQCRARGSLPSSLLWGERMEEMRRISVCLSMLLRGGTPCPFQTWVPPCAIRREQCSD